MLERLASNKVNLLVTSHVAGAATNSGREEVGRGQFGASKGLSIVSV